MSFFNLATLASSVGLTANKFAPGTPISSRVLAKFPSCGSCKIFPAIALGIAPS